MKKNKKKIINKLLILIIFLLNCTTCKNMIYQQNNNQEYYIKEKEIRKIKQGMTKKNIVEILGTPTLKNIFNNNNKWYYIVYIEKNNTKTYKTTISLEFNEKDILIKTTNEK